MTHQQLQLYIRMQNVLERVAAIANEIKENGWANEQWVMEYEDELNRFSVMDYNKA